MSHILHKVAPEVRLELERIHHGRLQIESADIVCRARLELLKAGWLHMTGVLFGVWLEIHPAALTGLAGKRQLRPNRRTVFGATKKATTKKQAGGRS
jgi:hypothetical protein